MTSEQLAALMGDQFETMERRMLERLDQRAAEIRAALMERLLELRSPNYAGNKKGELYIDGKMVIDFGPLFREIVSEAVAPFKPKAEP